MSRSELIDPRLRLAAACVLLAFDLPAPADAVGRQFLQAASIFPGLKPGEVSLGNRRALLLQARGLIELVITEVSDQ